MPYRIKKPTDYSSDVQDIVDVLNSTNFNDVDKVMLNTLLKSLNVCPAGTKEYRETYGLLLKTIEQARANAPKEESGVSAIANELNEFIKRGSNVSE